MTTIGIDPGAKGCMCILRDNMPYFYDWPKDNNFNYYFNRLVMALNMFHPIDLATLEQVSAMPGQGVTSMFNFGRNFGQWEAFLAIQAIPHRLVRPSVWMKGLVPKSDKKDTKESIREVVSKLYPNAELYGPKGGYMSGRGDSLLLAHYTKLQIPQT